MFGRLGRGLFTPYLLTVNLSPHFLGNAQRGPDIELHPRLIVVLIELRNSYAPVNSCLVRQAVRKGVLGSDSSRGGQNERGDEFLCESRVLHCRIGFGDAHSVEMVRPVMPVEPIVGTGMDGPGYYPASNPWMTPSGGFIRVIQSHPPSQSKHRSHSRAMRNIVVQSRVMCFTHVGLHCGQFLGYKSCRIPFCRSKGSVQPHASCSAHVLGRVSCCNTFSFVSHPEHGRLLQIYTR